jgi:hypothetical protein
MNKLIIARDSIANIVRKKIKQSLVSSREDRKASFTNQPFTEKIDFSFRIKSEG